MIKTIVIEGQECHLITKDALSDLVWAAASKMRRNDQTGLSSVKECLDILKCSRNTFYNRINEKGCKIKPSNVHGKYVTESVQKERDRKR